MTNNSHARIAVGLLIAVAFSLCSQTVFGQLRIVGKISGTVEDQTGAVIMNAMVTLKDSKTGITRQTPATERGTFLFPDLANGEYEITVSAPGFKSSILSN